MKSIYLKETKYTPEVVLDKDKGVFKFSGKSLPPDVIEFYKPIIEWFNEYIQNPNAETRLVCKMEYFNTASSKLMLDILGKLEKLAASGSKLSVDWYYDKDDEDLLETGQDYAKIVNIPFTFLPN